MLLGGWKSKSSFVYNAATNTWCNAASMSQCRAWTAAALWNGTVVVAGGSDENGTYLNSTEQYDPETNRWSAFKPMLTCRRGLALVAFNNSLFAIGGNDGRERLSSVERYDKVSNNWSMAPVLNQRRNITCAASSNVSKSLNMQFINMTI